MEEVKESLNFIEQIIESDLKENKNDGKVVTRFPPHPNGYLHIGHAKAICINFTLAEKYNGVTNLRFDDTNPIKEDTKYVEAIKRDIKWLGFKWQNEPLYASDYFDQLYDWAVILIKKGLAYVDDSNKEEMSEMRGVPNKPGIESPYRNRTVEENLELFEKMKNGEFENGEKVLRAKIDMASPNMHMRDPVMYRILNADHHRTGDKWCIYPMYDYAHGNCDSIEGVTHSLCSLEFEVHKPVYNWFIEKLDIFPSKQYEFARLNVNYSVTSKRKLLQLVEEGIVNGWDDPRMPTISGMRRRGFTAAAIRKFCDKVGVARRENVIDYGLLEFCVREDLNIITDRMMAVLNPLKVTLSNFDESHEEDLELIKNPTSESEEKRKMPFTKTIYIEREDFMEDAPKKFFRLKPEGVVRLKGAYIIHCDEVIKDASGEVTELVCSIIENSKSGSDTSGVKSKGVIHWVSAEKSIPIEIRLYDRLFTDENPDGHSDGTGFMDYINHDSLKVIKGYAEMALKDAKPEDTFQFMRKGYFCVDEDSTSDNLIFNLTVGLRGNYKSMKKN